MEQPSFMKVMSISTSLLFMLTLAVFGIQASENKPLLGNAYGVPSEPLRLASNPLKDKPAVLGASIVMAVISNQQIGTINSEEPTLAIPAKPLPIMPKPPVYYPSPTSTPPSNTHVQPIRNEIPQGATIIVKPTQAPNPQPGSGTTIKPVNNPSSNTNVVTKDLQTLNKDLLNQSNRITSMNKRIVTLEMQIKELQKQLIELQSKIKQNQMTAQ